jgi:hypothetical protein
MGYTMGSRAIIPVNINAAVGFQDLAKSLKIIKAKTLCT